MINQSRLGWINHSILLQGKLKTSSTSFKLSITRIHVCWILGKRTQTMRNLRVERQTITPLLDLKNLIECNFLISIQNHSSFLSTEHKEWKKSHFWSQQSNCINIRARRGLICVDRWLSKIVVVKKCTFSHANSQFDKQLISLIIICAVKLSSWTFFIA